MTIAKGTFSVKMTPQPADETGAGTAVGRFLLDKEFQGDLEGTSKGEMLAISTAVPGSAGWERTVLLFRLPRRGPVTRG